MQTSGTTKKQSRRLITRRSSLRSDSEDRRVVALRYRERRHLASVTLILLLGLLLTDGATLRETWLISAAFLVPPYIVHGVWMRRRHGADPLLLPLLHLLSGIGLLLMLSIGGLELAWEFSVGWMLGCAALLAGSLVDTRRRFWRRRHGVWLAVAMAAVLVLFAAGSGPAGSAARVNLDLPRLGRIQPIEVVKLCLLLFMAGYFARNWIFLRELRERRALPRLLRSLDAPRLRDVWPVTAGVALTLVSCFVLRDMGPALVMGSTFLVLYGMARGRWYAAAAGFAAMIGGFWLIYVTGAVPIVADRMSMLLSPWDNVVDGGEHLAHAYWAMASGGLTGTGLGLGSSGSIPAAHTDMVIPALGEELGLIGFVCMLLLYAGLFFRLFGIARGAPSALGVFLAAGSGLMLLFQLFLIAGGTTGLAPLSGIVTPFLSYGKSSMLVNCALLGIVASVSANEPAKEKRGRVRTSFRSATGSEGGRFETPLRLASALGLVILVAVGARAVQVQLFQANAWVVKPALVMRQSGERAYAYNPRIYAARDALGLGTIRDRNGVVLAVDRDDVSEQDTSVVDGSADRVYPLGTLTFYLLGDVNGRVKWGADNSLYAEHRFLSYLRGYDNRPATVRVDGRDVVRYDYSDLLPLIGRRRRSEAARRLFERSRDLDLTIDIRLQQATVKALEEMTPEGRTSSAVVLDAATGEVLASATYPLPTLERPSDVHADPAAFDRGFGRGAKPPGSTFKLVTAMAALDGDPSSAEWKRVVRASDRYARRGEPTGTTGMRRALVSSSNVYFAALAHEVVGTERLLAVLEVFGFRVGSPGLSRREKIQLLNAPDNLRQAGFGQGPVVGGPLQVAHVAAAVANGGLVAPIRWIRKPKTLSATHRKASRDGRATTGVRPATTHNQPPTVDHPLPTDNQVPTVADDRRRDSRERTLTRAQAQFLASAMRGVITDPRGTARSLRESPVPIAGKTGTAEEDGLQNHAWFAGFAPYDAEAAPYDAEAGSASASTRRTIAVGVLVEEGGPGGAIAAPIARAIIESAAEIGIIEIDTTERAASNAPRRLTTGSSVSATSSSTTDQTTLGPTTLISSANR